MTYQLIAEHVYVRNLRSNEDFKRIVISPFMAYSMEEVIFGKLTRSAGHKFHRKPNIRFHLSGAVS